MSKAIPSVISAFLPPNCRNSWPFFLACPQADWQQVWKELHEKLQKHKSLHNISTVFYDLHAFGLYHSHHAHKDFIMHHLPTKIQVLFDAQSYLGFKQLYYAWLTPHWISTIEYHHPEINCKNYMAKSPRLTWQAVLHIWTLQNVHLHPSNHKQEDCSQLQAAANQFFHQAQQDPTILQDLVDSLTPDRIMTWPTWLIWAVGYQLPQPHASSQKHFSYKLDCTHMISNAT